MKRIGILVVMLMGLMPAMVLAQGTEPPMYNPNSVTPIAEYEQLYKKRVWRRMDLKEKQNKSFFAFNKEITKLIIEAVDRGEIFPYTNDSLVTRMSKEQFFENLELEDYGVSNEDEFGLSDSGDTGGDEGGWGDSGWGDSESSDDSGSGWGDTDTGGAEGTSASSGDDGPGLFLPSDVSILEIMEDMVFDKRRSRLYYDIQAITLIIPAENFAAGIFRPVGTFRYKDLEQLFRDHPQEAIWFNPQNSAEHKNFADAMELRLHSARITKIQNTDNQPIIEIYENNPLKAVMASQQLEHELMEYEHDLWEQ